MHSIVYKTKSLRGTKRSLAVIAVLFVALLAGVVGYKVAHAADTVYGVNYKVGYFTGDDGSAHYNSSGGTIWDNVWKDYGGGYTIAVPANLIQTKADFISFVEDKLKNGTHQDKIGAAFIINLMVKRTAANAMVHPDDAMIADWKSRINNDSVIYNNHKMVSYEVNSTYHMGIKDDMFFAISGTLSDYAATFTVGGTDVFKLRLDCANPVGGVGLPEASEEVSSKVKNVTDSTAYSSEVNAMRGDTVRFQHNVTFPTATTAKRYWIVEGNGTGAYPTVDDNRTHGSFNVGTTGSNDIDPWTMTIPASTPIPSKICQHIVLSPDNDFSDTSGKLTSVKACVNVSDGYTGDWILYPNTTVNPTDVITPDTQNVSATTSVGTYFQNSSIKSDDDIRWDLSRIIVPPGVDPASRVGDFGQSCDGSTMDWHRATKWEYNSSGDDWSKTSCVLWRHYEQRRHDTPYPCSPASDVPHYDPVTGEYLYTTYRCSNTVSAHPGCVLDGYTLPGGGKEYPNNCVIYVYDYDPVAQFGSYGSVAINDQTYQRARNLTPGTQVCYFTTVSKGSQDRKTTKRSPLKCLTVIHTPFVHIQGSDVRVGSIGGNSALSTDNLNSKVQGLLLKAGGSSSEYAVLAPSTITSFGSASGAYWGSASPNSSGQSSWGKSSLANQNVSGACSGTYGCFSDRTKLGTLPNPAKYFKSIADASDDHNTVKGVVYVSPSAVPSSSVSSTLSSIGFGTTNFNGSVVLDMTGRNAVIDSNITYSNAASGVTLPQLVIIANNITINPNVTRVDAWLVAVTGNVETCDNTVNFGNAATVAYGNCGDPLIINGPVMSKRLALKRTSFDWDKQTVAETIDMRGDTYLWADSVARQNARWQTTYTMELPPRY